MTEREFWSVVVIREAISLPRSAATLSLDTLWFETRFRYSKDENLKEQHRFFLSPAR